MKHSDEEKSLQGLLQGLTQKKLCGLDYLSKGSLTERVISLVLGEVSPPASSDLQDEWRTIATTFRELDSSNLRVVVLGGGTGLSNIVGGDSRRQEWRETPFVGLKERFPDLHSIVCVTDDGGSTGELLKDFPLVALGDLRHVLLSSICSRSLQEKYSLDRKAASGVAAVLHALFNYRFISAPSSVDSLLADIDIRLDCLPASLAAYLDKLLQALLHDQRMKPSLYRPQCLGNLLLAAAIYSYVPETFDPALAFSEQNMLQYATLEGLGDISEALGAGRQSVLPATTTPAELQVLYANGVLVTSECKSSSGKRGYPIDRVVVEFAHTPHLPQPVTELIQTADIIIMAPGSLYTSIIPILQVPGVADLIRNNTRALKLLVANIWVQKGETDATRDAPERKFHVSDLIRAYDYNISGGIKGLFSHILSLDLADVSGAVLQNYALEAKEPIYLDAGRVRQFGLEPVESCIFSRELLQQRHVIQHDPSSFALVVQVLWGLRSGGFLSEQDDVIMLPFSRCFPAKIRTEGMYPNQRYRRIRDIVSTMTFTRLTPDFPETESLPELDRIQMIDRLVEIIWRHPDVQIDHLQFVSRVCFVDTTCWKRCQQWDNVFSFYNPEEKTIQIRLDQITDLYRLEMAFLVGIGQSLLGNYALTKKLDTISFQGDPCGQIYCLSMQKAGDLHSYFSLKELDRYLQMARMCSCPGQERLYTRVVNGDEGFTPPGLLFGLVFVWYLDNQFAPNIDYKMSIMKNELSYLIPEQVKIVGRREQLIRFFRENVFRQNLPQDNLQSKN